MVFFESEKLKKIVILSLILIVAIGVFFRFHNITENQFFYYDEGMWLNANRGFVSVVSNNPPQNFGETLKILNVSLKLSLSSAKSLWLFLSNLRGLFASGDSWYFSRILSAIFGTLTLLLVFLFSKRYHSSNRIALLSVALLAILPSHVYYSRLALQESLSTFCFLAGLYFYVFPRKFSIRTFISGAFFALVFFSSYRMIIIPVIIGFCEFFISFAEKQKINFRKYFYNTLTFFFFIFVIGSINNGENIYVTFAWMFHQSNLARGHFSFINLFSYPYYLFKLESVFFALLFFANVYFIKKKEYKCLLPFALSMFLMALFSFPQEKGVRYLCSAMPLMVLAVSSVVAVLLDRKRKDLTKIIAIFLVVFMSLVHLVKAREIIQFKTDYETSVEDIAKVMPNAKIVSTQDMVQSLYVEKRSNVVEAPRDFKRLLTYYAKGFRYLVVCPQAYLSYTEDKARFSSKLGNYLNFVTLNVPPVKVYKHFSPALLERFVLEHNENLINSIKFLKLAQEKNFGSLKVYSLNQCLVVMRKLAESQN